MIEGEVTPYREATILLPLLGASGQSVEVEAVLGTGFTDFLTLPSDLIATLQLTVDVVDGGRVTVQPIP